MARTLFEVFTEIESWDNIADELIRKGIKGEREDCQRCPIAQYVLRETGADFVDVDGYETTVIWNKGKPDERYDDYEHGEKVQDFIYRFDHCDYPDLDMYPIDEFDEEEM